jgi:hypothetical protein
MILAFLHYVGSSPTSSDVWKRIVTLSFTTGHICFHIIAGSPSSPGAFHDCAANTLRSTSFTERRGIGTGARWGRGPSSSITAGSGGKKVASNSLACSVLSVVLDPSILTKGGILSNATLPSGFRYFAACQMFALFARKSS